MLLSNKGDIMKILVFVFMMLNFASAYCAGVLENPVNVQEIDLKYIDDITISYKSENVVLFKNNSDMLIIKEYMSKDNRDYYAKITNSQNKLVVEAGRRPFPFLFDTFTARIEVYIPVTNKNVTVKTSSGKIEGKDEYTASSIDMECSSGNISVNSIIAKTVNFRASSGSIRCKEVTGNTAIDASSGSIFLSSINGDISAEASSGSIELNSVNGSVNVNASSGSIYCTVTENAGDISITSSSGSVSLNIPKNFAFKFSSRTSSGSLRTPFPDRLFSPISDRNSVQGVINDDNSKNLNLKNINIKTSSGSVKINWVG
jgi:DUF4097 and DUF4098 domain-containing protein YvlB